jgi:hypothetical protein
MELYTIKVLDDKQVKSLSTFDSSKTKAYIKFNRIINKYNMKKIVTFLAVIALTSCTKTIETTSELGTSSYDYEFTGSKDEMQTFEANGNKDYPSLNMSQTTNCN